MNVTDLKKAHGDKAPEVFAQIAELGGFGHVGPEENSLSPDANLDLTGVLDPANKAVSDDNKNKIRELAGIKAEKGDK